MASVKNLCRRIWDDQLGAVLCVEVVSVATIAVLGLLVSLSTVRNAILSELSDVAGAVQDFNQGYICNSVVGHSATTNGSSYIDSTDHCDDPEDISGSADNCITMEVLPTNESSGLLVDSLFEAEGPDVTATVGASVGNGWILWSNGRSFFDLEIPEDGEYTFSANLWASLGGPDLANAEFLVDGTALGDFDIAQTSFATAGVYSVIANLAAGIHQFAVGFTNDYYAPPVDRNLFIDWLQVTGPN